MASKVLITGGCGFVGRHFCKYFLDAGAEIWVVDNIAPLTGGIDPSAGWPLYEPRDYVNFRYFGQDCRIFFEQNPDEKFDLVLHLAAMVGGREMIEANPLVVAEDLSIDSMFWLWASQARPEKIICFSSSAAYPISYQTIESHRLLSEDMISFGNFIGMPDMSYGWAKLTNEYLARLANERYGLNSICYRPFSGYGEDQDRAYPFPSICSRVISNLGAETIEVWGTGDQMRDFIHISDCVRGVMTTFEAFNDGSAVNLSTGKLTSFKSFVSIAASILGFSPEVLGTSKKPEGVFARGGDTALQKKLGFVASIDFEEGISRALKFFADNK